jgi:hypothetical protein
MIPCSTVCSAFDAERGWGGSAFKETWEWGLPRGPCGAHAAGVRSHVGVASGCAGRALRGAVEGVGSRGAGSAGGAVGGVDGVGEGAPRAGGARDGARHVRVRALHDPNNS